MNVPGFPGVSGSGYLAVLHFHVIGSAGDSSAIELSEGFLNNKLTHEVKATWTGDSVTVCQEISNTASPVPVYLIAAYLGAALVALASYFFMIIFKSRKV